MAGWLGAGSALLLLGAAVLPLAQRLGALRLARIGLDRLTRRLPAGMAGSLRGLHGELLRLRRDRGALWRTGLLHLLAWMLGCGETWLWRWRRGRGGVRDREPGHGARSVAFAISGALGVQEGGFILVGGLFGIPADAAIALSMVKRARELLVGVPGLLAWHWSELRRPVARSQGTSRRPARFSGDRNAGGHR